MEKKNPIQPFFKEKERKKERKMIASIYVGFANG